MSWRLYHNFQGLILVGWGLFLLDRMASGRLLFYINSRYVILVLLAALTFFVLAQAVMTHRTEGGQSEDDTSDGTPHSTAQHGHGHGHGERPSSWALLALALPLLLGVIMPVKELDAEVMSMRGLNTTAPAGSLSHLVVTSVGLAPDERSVLDWVGIFNSTSSFASYEGQTASVTGFVYHHPLLADDRFLVSRFVVTCCVADASALGMVVSSPASATLADNQWVRVEGEIYTAEIDGERLPAIKASSIELIDAPDQPYLYP